MLQWGRDHLVAETRRSGTQAGPRTPSFNGAATIWSRKLPLLKLAPPVTTALQWGRDHLVAETLQNLALANGSSVQVLQWGRDHLVAETVMSLPPDPADMVASMGPRPSGRGNPRYRISSRVYCRRFNGAATIWSRKQRTASAQVRGCEMVRDASGRFARRVLGSTVSQGRWRNPASPPSLLVRARVLKSRTTELLA